MSKGFTAGFSVKIYILIIAVSAMIFLPACTQVQRRPEYNRNRQYNYQEEHNQRNQEPAPIRAQLDDESVIRVAERINPSVVGISTIHRSPNNWYDTNELIYGIGSGVIVNEKGFILTNDHVVGNDAAQIIVILQNGDELEGEVLWTDPTLDLAIVKVNADNLPAAPLGDSDKLMVGEPAIAIGTPLGLQFQHTVTAGIISALNRTIEVPTGRGQNFMEDLIQTDASINPGNSGGPLLNIHGEVIGINTVKVITAEGIGFAIPIEIAKPIIMRCIEEGRFITPYIGVVGYDKEMASFLTRNDSIEEGVYVMEIDPRGPGYLGGIRIDDVITRVGDERVVKMLDLRKAIYNHRVGDKIDITVIRRGREMDLTIVLEEKRTP